MSKKTKNDNPKSLTAFCTREDEEKAFAQTYLRPTILAATAIKGQYTHIDKINVNALVDELGRQVSLVNEGNLIRVEGMLISQAHTLDALFADLLGRSRANMGEYINAAEKYMRLALKAQSQCRATLETLAEVKNPRPYIQNNRAEYQQVNNSADSNSKTNTRTHAHTEKSFSTNELLEDKTHEQEWLDTRTPTEAIRSD
jgi:hypothetical protein